MVLSASEHERFRDGFRQLNEITEGGDTLSVRRFRDGLLDSSLTAAPVATYSISTCRTLSERHCVAGHEASREEASEDYRIENPGGPAPAGALPFLQDTGGRRRPCVGLS